jgi:hypothetical protein
LAGWLGSPATFDRTRINPSGVASLALVRFTAAGAVDWTRTYPAVGGADTPTRQLIVRSNAAGELLVAGQFAQPIDFGVASKTCGITLAMFEANGSPRVVTCLPNPPGMQGLDGVVFDDAGNATVSFYAKGGPYDVGDGQHFFSGPYGSLLVKIGRDGTTLWSRPFVYGYARGLAADAAGNVYTFGDVPGLELTGSDPPVAIMLGDQLWKPCAGLLRHHVSKISPQGSTLWTRLVGGSLDQLAADAAGNVFVMVQGSGAIGDGLAFPAGVGRVVVKVSPEGAPLWLQSMANVSETDSFLNFGQMTTDTAGAVLVTGTFKGSIAFAPMPLTLTHVGWGEFLVKFAP